MSDETSHSGPEQNIVTEQTKIFETHLSHAFIRRDTPCATRFTEAIQKGEVTNLQNTPIIRQDGRRDSFITLKVRPGFTLNNGRIPETMELGGLRNPSNKITPTELLALGFRPTTEQHDEETDERYTIWIENS